MTRKQEADKDIGSEVKRNETWVKYLWNEVIYKKQKQTRMIWVSDRFENLLIKVS